MARFIQLVTVSLSCFLPTQIIVITRQVSCDLFRLAAKCFAVDFYKDLPSVMHRKSCSYSGRNLKERSAPILSVARFILQVFTIGIIPPVGTSHPAKFVHHAFATACRKNDELVAFFFSFSFQSLEACVFLKLIAWLAAKKSAVSVEAGGFVSERHFK